MKSQEGHDHEVTRRACGNNCCHETGSESRPFKLSSSMSSLPVRGLVLWWWFSQGYQFGGDKGGRRAQERMEVRKASILTGANAEERKDSREMNANFAGNQNTTAPPTSSTPSQAQQQQPRNPNGSDKRVFNLAAGDAHFDPPFVQYALDADEHEYHDASVILGGCKP